MVLDIGGSRTLEAGSIRSVKTRHPRAALLSSGDQIVVDAENGLKVEGEVRAQDEKGFTLLDGTKQYDIKWIGVLRIEVLPPDEHAVDVKELGVTPLALFTPQPTYPPIARESGASGSVMLEIVVDTAGQVVSARVVKLQYPFDAAALVAVKKWRYQPVIVDGRAVFWKGVVQMQFLAD